jgi:flagellar M-ring protein FliF
VMLSSQRMEDSAGSAGASGVPGAASTLPRPTSRPASSTSRTSRVSENITYQSSRTVKKTHLPAGVIRKISVAVLVDQALSWERDKGGFRRVLTPPSPEKLKVIHDLVAGVTGFSAERGDQLVVETQPFETTLLIEPPPLPAAPAAPPAAKGPQKLLQLDQKTLLIGGAALAAAVVGIAVVIFLRSKPRKAAVVTAPAELAAGSGSSLEQQIESRLTEHEALQQQADAKLLSSLKLAPVITKTGEVMAKHLREKISQEPEVAAQVLRTWIREEET